MANPAKSEGAALQVVTKETPTLVEFSSQAAVAKLTSENYVIDSREMFEIADVELSNIRALEKKVEETRVGITGPLNAAMRNTNKLFKPISDALDEAKRKLGAKMIAFEDAERVRVQAAEKAALEEQRRAIAQAEAQVAEAAEQMQRGEIAPADYAAVAGEAMAAAVGVPVGVVEAAPDRGGHSRRSRFVAEITNLPDFLEHLAGLLRKGDPTFDNTVEIKVGQLNAFGSSTQGSVVIPGITFRKESTFAARS